MSNYDLRAQVSRLQSELNRIESENNKLRAEISSTVNSVNEAERNLSQYNQHIRNSLDNANATINHSINTAISAYELQGQIDNLYKRYKHVELANKKIRELNNKKYYDFNNYRTVRKIVQGMMDNLDLSMVNDKIIYKSIEREHLKTPDFWLTCVLISIMAWKSDEKPLADRAMAKAIELDKKNSSIFYMIFNLRMERDEAAVKWFLEYQKCELKGSDENTFLMMFSLISKTLTENVDFETADLISDFINRLIVECANREGYSEEELVHEICKKMQGLMKVESYEFPLLGSYCKDYNNILSMLNLAKNNYNILESILKIIHVPLSEKNTYLKEYLNELLAKPNEAEISTYNEIEYNELIIKLHGDVEQAKEIFDKEMNRRTSEFDIISTMVEWVYDFGNENINEQMRLNMFVLLKTLQEKAANLYFDKYRKLYTVVHPVEIQDYKTNVNFKDESGEMRKAETHYQTVQEQELASVKDTSAYVAFGVGAACTIASFFTTLILLAGLGIGLIVGIGTLISNKNKRKNIVLRIQKQKQSTLDILHKLFLEHNSMIGLFSEFDAVSTNILEELAKL